MNDEIRYGGLVCLFYAIVAFALAVIFKTKPEDIMIISLFSDYFYNKGKKLYRERYLDKDE